MSLLPELARATVLQRWNRHKEGEREKERDHRHTKEGETDFLVSVATPADQLRVISHPLPPTRTPCSLLNFVCTWFKNTKMEEEKKKKTEAGLSLALVISKPGRALCCRLSAGHLVSISSHRNQNTCPWERIRTKWESEHLPGSHTNEQCGTELWRKKNTQREDTFK